MPPTTTRLDKAYNFFNFSIFFYRCFEHFLFHRVSLKEKLNLILSACPFVGAQTWTKVQTLYFSFSALPIPVERDLYLFSWEPYHRFSFPHSKNIARVQNCPDVLNWRCSRTIIIAMQLLESFKNCFTTRNYSSLTVRKQLLAKFLFHLVATRN